MARRAGAILLRGRVLCLLLELRLLRLEIGLLSRVRRALHFELPWLQRVRRLHGERSIERHRLGRRRRVDRGAQDQAGNEARHALCLLPIGHRLVPDVVGRSDLSATQQVLELALADRPVPLAVPDVVPA